MLKIAFSLPDKINLDTFLHQSIFQDSSNTCEPSCWDIVRGILPSLQFIINRDQDSLKWKCKLKSNVPDVHPNSSYSSIDPFGNDYFCKICSYELCNAYFHCNGCETILGKDFNICIECFKEDAYCKNIEMNHQNENLMSSHFHHCGRPSMKCCHPSSECLECSFCQKCLLSTCICHKSFQKRYRFYSVDQQQARLEQCQQLIHGNYVKYSIETEHRLRGEAMIPMNIKEADQTVDDVGASATDSEPRNVDLELSSKDIIAPRDDLASNLVSIMGMDIEDKKVTDSVTYTPSLKQRTDTPSKQRTDTLDLLCQKAVECYVGWTTGRKEVNAQLDVAEVVREGKRMRPSLVRTETLDKCCKIFETNKDSLQVLVAPSDFPEAV